MEEHTTQPEPSKPTSPAEISPVSVDHAPEKPVGTVQKLPHNGGSSKKILIVLSLILVFAAAIAGVASFLNHKTSPKTAAVEVKKDIPLITYASGDRGFNSFYPDIDNSSNFTTPNRQIFEGLVRWENANKIVPLLATSWTNPDTSTWVFSIKPGVKFHTGRVMTADDIKASFEASKTSDYGGNFNTTIKSVTVLGPLKVEIKTDGPDPVLLNRLTSLYIFDTASVKKNDPINGTGPYILKPGSTLTNDNLELVSFDSYHGGHVYTRALAFTYIPIDKLADSFNMGTVNYAEYSFGSGDFSRIKRANKRIDVQPLSVFHLILNTRREGSPLANLKVRQAILVGTDPLALAKVRQAVATPIGQMIPPTVPGYLPSISRPATDVLKAKSMLAEAGYPNGFSITFTYYGASKTTAEELSRQFKAIGITLKLDPINITKDLAAKVYGGKTDMSFNTFSTDIFDGTDVLAQFLDSQNYTNPKVGPILSQVNKTLDQSARLKLIQQLVQIAVDDVVDIPMYAGSKAPQFIETNFVVQHDLPGGDEVGTYFWKVYSK